MLLSQPIQELPVSQLHLSKKLCDLLIESGIATVGQLLSISDQDLQSIEGIDYNFLRQLKKAKGALEASLCSAGEIDWLKYLEIQEVVLIPSWYESGTSPSRIIEFFTKIIKGIIKEESKDWERSWTIVQRRFALENTDKLSLEDLGHIFDLTRERVRQIEAQMLVALKTVLVNKDYSGKSYRIHPEILLTLDGLISIVVSQAHQTALEAELINQVEQGFDLEFDEFRQSFNLLFSLLGVARVEFDDSNLESILGFLDAIQKREIEWVVKSLDELLTESSPQSKNELDILLAINKKLYKVKRLSLPQIRSYIRLCSSVERRLDDSIWGKFECLNGRSNQIERLLLENGKPMGISEIAREINSRLVPLGQRKIQERRVQGQLCSDERFVPIGKSGYWGLKTWEHLDTGSIVEVMEEFFLIRNKPATADEVYNYVSERRPVSKKSIIAYLGINELSKNKFAKIDRTTWGLASWSEAANAVTWNPEQVAEFVASVFKTKRVKELDYKIIKQALMEKVNITDREAQGLLNINPVIKTRRDLETNKLYAIFQSDYANIPIKIGTKDSRKSLTLREQIDTTVREILEAAPNQQVSLAELVERVQRKYSCPKHTAYQYISKLDYVERFDVAGSGVRVCKIKDVSSKLVFPKVQEICSQNLRSNIERALLYLNEEAVDIGLFLLSKEFEVTLKNYLVTADLKGSLVKTPGPDVNKWKLNNMIDCLVSNKIIIDNSIPHFLRQERNYRAHGEMPSLAERRVLMSSVPSVAGMYVDYIKLFDDLLNSLL
jgi:Sigma-70, region 4